MLQIEYIFLWIPNGECLKSIWKKITNSSQNLTIWIISNLDPKYIFFWWKHQKSCKNYIL